MRQAPAMAVLAVLPALTAAAGSTALRSTAFEMAYGARIVVPATLNGVGPFRFVLDTGSTHSAISERLARLADAPAVARAVVTSPLGRQVRLVVRLERLVVGPVNASGVLPTVVRDDDLDDMGDVDGLIGQDVLGTRHYTLDFRAQRVVWHHDSLSGGTGGVTLGLEWENGRFVVALPQEHAALRFVPDSGTQGLVLFRRRGNLLPSLTAVPGHAELATVEDRRDVRQVRVRELRLGQVTLRDVPAVVVDRGNRDSPDGDGLLPLHIFDRVTFDGPRRVLIIEPRRPEH